MNWFSDWLESRQSTNMFGVDSVDTPLFGEGQNAIGATVNEVVNNDDQTLGQSEYDFTYKAFPNDLGMDYAGHYMVININVPVKLNSNDGRGQFADGANKQFDILSGEFSKVDVLRFGNSSPGGSGQRGSYAFPRATRRIKESIALYMPGTQLIFNGMNSYEEIGMTALAGQVGVGALQAALITGGALFASPAGAATAAGAAAAIGAITSGVGSGIGTASKILGMPINPRVEVLFATTLLRDFQFEFIMMPRNAKEAETIHRIVRTLRFHSAPEIEDQLYFVPTFIPPAEFDITFFHRGAENKKLPRINTCVLTRCEVDYAPGSGIYSTFKDGYPTAVRLMLVFKELEVVHKLRILQGF